MMHPGLSRPRGLPSSAQSWQWRCSSSRVRAGSQWAQARPPARGGGLELRRRRRFCTVSFSGHADVARLGVLAMPGQPLLPPRPLFPAVERDCHEVAGAQRKVFWGSEVGSECCEGPERSVVVGPCAWSRSAGGGRIIPLGGDGFRCLQSVRSSVWGGQERGRSPPAL